MRIVRTPHTPRRGVAAVELACTMPLLLILMTGIWEVGRMVHVKQIVSNAAREGARSASVGTNNYAKVKQVVESYLSNSGLNNANVTVEVRNLTTGNNGPDYDPSTAVQLDDLEVYVSLPFANVQWAALDQVTDLNAIDARVRWFCTKDVPITIDLSGGGIPKSVVK